MHYIEHNPCFASVVNAIQGQLFSAAFRSGRICLRGTVWSRAPTFISQMPVQGGHLPNWLVACCTTSPPTSISRVSPPYDAQPLLSAASYPRHKCTSRAAKNPPAVKTLHSVFCTRLKFEWLVYCLLSSESSSISWGDWCTHTQAIWTHPKPKEPRLGTNWSK